MQRRDHRGRGKEDENVRISKTLSYILRHGAEKEGLDIGSDGYVRLQDLLALPKFRGVTVSKIEEIVENNDKKRFQLTTKLDSEGINCKHIRASQGHTISSLNDEELMKEQILDASKYPVVVHGTFRQFWDPISRQGLKAMSRNHVHFASGYPGDKGVISGMRKTCDIYIELDLAKALADGLVFYLSHNGVILSAGINGTIPTKYFKRVTDANNRIIEIQPVSAQAVHVVEEEKKSDDVQQKNPVASSAAENSLAAEENEKKKKKRIRKKDWESKQGSAASRSQIAQQEGQAQIQPLSSNQSVQNSQSNLTDQQIQEIEDKEKKEL